MGRERILGAQKRADWGCGAWRAVLGTALLWSAARDRASFRGERSRKPSRRRKTEPGKKAATGSGVHSEKSPPLCPLQGAWELQRGGARVAGRCPRC